MTIQKTILLIEDEHDLREVLAEELVDAGYRVDQAADGHQALQSLAGGVPDLILCDITMPGIDGYQLLHTIRESRPDLASVPFVFLTAHDGSGQIIRGKYAGADDYLVKPVNFDLMLATIEARLRQVQRMHGQVASLAESVAIPASHPAVFQNLFRLLDFVAPGIVALDGQAVVGFANAAAKSMAADGLCAPLVQMLETGSALQQPILWNAIQPAIAAAGAGEDHTSFLSLRRTDKKRDVLVTVCSLVGAPASRHLHSAAAAPETVTTQDPASPPVAGDMLVALFFHAGSRDEPAPMKALEALFRLTPTESRVAWAFAQGMRPADIASMFDISQTTVAFHKRNIFQKTQTNRQADLIALLLTLPVAIADI